MFQKWFAFLVVAAILHNAAPNVISNVVKRSADADHDAWKLCGNYCSDHGCEICYLTAPRDCKTVFCHFIFSLPGSAK
ncbi:hypothetical protein COOONC_09468 [Cooperia oncophora]